MTIHSPSATAHINDSPICEIATESMEMIASSSISRKNQVFQDGSIRSESSGTHMSTLSQGIRIDVTLRSLDNSIELDKDDDDDDKDEGLLRSMSFMSSSIASDLTMLVVPKTLEFQLARPLPPSYERVNNYSDSRTGERHVCFHKVQIRRYAMIAGDNPACMIGTPVTLDWGYEELPPFDLDYFENSRNANRRHNMHQFLLSYFQRYRILKGIGYSDDTIRAMERNVARARYERQITIVMLPFFRLEQLSESLQRKLERTMNGNVRKSKEEMDAAIQELRRQDTMRKRPTAIQMRALCTGGCLNLAL